MAASAIRSVPSVDNQVVAHPPDISLNRETEAPQARTGACLAEAPQARRRE
jgi:hypothetical protein